MMSISEELRRFENITLKWGSVIRVDHLTEQEYIFLMLLTDTESDCSTELFGRIAHGSTNDFGPLGINKDYFPIIFDSISDEDFLFKSVKYAISVFNSCEGESFNLLRASILFWNPSEYQRFDKHLREKMNVSTFYSKFPSIFQRRKQKYNYVISVKEYLLEIFHRVEYKDKRRIL